MKIQFNAILEIPVEEAIALVSKIEELNKQKNPPAPPSPSTNELAGKTARLKPHISDKDIESEVRSDFKLERDVDYIIVESTRNYVKIQKYFIPTAFFDISDKPEKK